MNECVCICLFVRVCAYKFVCLCVYVCRYSLCVGACVFVHVCTCECVLAYVYFCVRVFLRMCVCTYACSCDLKTERACERLMEKRGFISDLWKRLTHCNIDLGLLVISCGSQDVNV